MCVDVEIDFLPTTVQLESNTTTAALAVVIVNSFKVSPPSLEPHATQTNISHAVRCWHVLPELLLSFGPTPR